VPGFSKLNERRSAVDFQRTMSLVSRVLFVSSFLLLAVAVLERITNGFGYTFLGATGYAASRLLEFAVILLVFVIALLLRQIREEMKRLKT
jgi:hypothetical protein